MKFFLIILLVASCSISKSPTIDSKDSPTKAKAESLSADSSKTKDILDENENAVYVQKLKAIEYYAMKKNDNATIHPKIHVQNGIIDDKIIDKVNKTANKENNGLIAYSVPEHMQVGYDYNVKIRITKDKNEKQELIIGDKKIPINDVNTKSVIVIESIRVSTVMSAELTSEKEDFNITSLSTELQDIEDNGYTEWEWHIMPLKSGKNPLKLLVKVRIADIDHENVYKDVVVFEREINIKANYWYSVTQFFINYWQWIVSTIVLPLLAWLYKRKKDKEKASETSSDDSTI